MTEGAGKLATAGLRVRALFKGGHKIIEYIEPGGAASRNGTLEVGDVIMGVDGIPAEKLTVSDIESVLTGHAGTLVRLQVCNGKELQAHADQVQARADMLDLELAGIGASIKNKEGKCKVASEPLSISMREAVLELLPGTMADAFEDSKTDVLVSL